MTLGSRADLTTYVPMRIEASERAKLRTELEGHQPYAVVFDGTTRLGEVIAVAARFVTQEFQLKRDAALP